MVEKKHTLQELKMRQALPLDAKISMTKLRIRQWVEHYGIDGVYVSFSGGKDSTVLLHIARSIYPEMRAMFIDTGLEYPEIRDFVKTFEHVDIVKPKLTFKQVIEKYGYPFISKEVSETVFGARKYLTELTKHATITKAGRQAGRQHRIITDTNAYLDLINLLKRKMQTRAGGSNERLLILLGELPTKTGNFPKSRYNCERYKFFIDAPFEISNRCCNVMKKEPAAKYTKQTGRVPIIGTLAEESWLRMQKWLQNGCNAFESKKPVSNPLSFWTNQDILNYIVKYNVKICSVYGDIVPDYGEEQINGQMDFADLGLIGDNRKYKTTGCARTGCMFCGFGCHLEKEGEGRFELMKKTHPKQYDYIMRSKEKGGLNYKFVIDWINEHGHFNIKY